MGDNYFLLTNLLSEDERKVITGIAAHIERGEKRVGIQQIANENFLSTTSIVKMCKRLGFDGYSELYYHLSRQLASSGDRKAENLKSLIDNYDDALVERFCALLRERRSGKMFTTGEGFSNIVGTYITQRLSICGFMAFNNVHFYDYMLFQEAHRGAVNDEAAPSARAARRSRSSTTCATQSSTDIRSWPSPGAATPSSRSFPTLYSCSTGQSRRSPAACRIPSSGTSFWCSRI